MLACGPPAADQPARVADGEAVRTGPPRDEGVSLRDYELVTIWNPDLEDDTMTGALDRLRSTVATRGGEVTDTNIWGRRRLAYHINRHAEGIYVVMQLRVEPRRAAEIESQLRLNEDVLRHLLVRKDEK